MDSDKRSKEIIETYDIIAPRYSDKYDSETKDNNLLDSFLSHIKSSNARILDLGSGTGRTSGYIKSKKPDFLTLGIDISDGMLEIARKNFHDLEFQKGDITMFDSSPESFDAVIAQSSLFHLDKEELEKLTHKIYSMLKDGGVFGILMQTTEEYKCVSLPEPLMPELTMHLCFYSEKDLEEILLNSGFKIAIKQKNEISASKISSYKLLIVGVK